MNQPDLDKLIKRCKAQSQQGQVQLYQKYSSSMFGTAYRILGDKQDAEDAMQEGFLKAFTKIDTYRYDAPFEAWLRRIITNEALALYRKNKRTNTLPLEIEFIPKESQIEIPRVEENLAMEKVDIAMSRLKDRYRIAIHLYLIEGFNYEELSEYLKISNGNCRAIVSRAKHALRKEISQL